MKLFLQTVAFVLIVVIGFLLGLKWGMNQAPSLPPEIIPPVVSTPTPTPAPLPTTPEPTPEPVAEEPVLTPEVPPVPTPLPSNIILNGQLPQKTSDKVNTFRNGYFKYSFDIPANVYYSSFGAQGGAQHSVGIAKDDPATFDDSAVKFYFFTKAPVELGTAASLQDPNGKFLYKKMGESAYIKIEALDISSPIVQKILETLKVN